MLFDVFHGGETLAAERTHMFLLMVRQVSVHVQSKPLLQNHPAADCARSLLFCRLVPLQMLG